MWWKNRVWFPVLLGLTTLACEPEAAKPPEMEPFEQSRDVFERRKQVESILSDLAGRQRAARVEALEKISALDDRTIHSEQEAILAAIQEVLRGTDAELSRATLKILRRLETPGMHTLRGLLTGSDPELRQEAARAMSRMGEKGSRLMISTVAGIDGAGSGLRQVALDAIRDQWLEGDMQHRLDGLGMLGLLGRSALPLLVASLQDPDPSVRQKSLSVLTGLGPLAAEAWNAVDPLRGDPDPLVRRAVLRFAVEVRSREQVKRVLEEALADKDTSVRLQSVHVLDRLEPDQGVLQLLARTLGDSESTVAVAAAEVIRNKGPAASRLFPALEKACDSSHARVRGACVDALGKVEVDPARLVPAYVRLLSNRDPVVRVMVAKRLGEMGQKARAALDALKRAKDDEDERVSRAADLALLFVRPKKG